MNSLLDDLRNAFQSGQMYTRLIIANVSLFLAYNILIVLLKLFGLYGFIATENGGINLLNKFIMMPPQAISLLLKPWTLITYAFFHEGLFHILFNMLWLYWFGRIFVDMLGNAKLFDVYILGGIAGGFFYFVFYNIFPSISSISGGPLLGASGAVYAVVVATAVLVPDYTIMLILIGPVKIKYIAMFTVVLSFLSIAGSNSGGNLAHLGGAAMGYLYMTQLRNGVDWGKPVRYVSNGVMGLFSPKVKMTVQQGGSKKSASFFGTSPKSTSASSPSSTPSEEEIDMILDKINKSGYESLSKEEKQKLYNASKGGN